MTDLKKLILFDWFKEEPRKPIHIHDCSFCGRQILDNEGYRKSGRLSGDIVLRDWFYACRECCIKVGLEW